MANGGFSLDNPPSHRVSRWQTAFPPSHRRMKADRNITRRIDLTTLQLFAAVCESGSIGKAAEAEFIAASALSKRVSDLETSLGTALLYRHSRGVEPTPAGQSLLHHARSVLFGLEKMHAELAEFAGGVRGHVRMHANISAIVQFLPEDLGAFARAHDHIKVDLEEHVSQDVIRAVSEGAADVGVCNTSTGAAGLQTLPYRQDRLVLVCPRQHELAQRALEHLSERSEVLPKANLERKQLSPTVLPTSVAINFENSLIHDHVGLHANSSVYLAMRRAVAGTGRAIKLRIHVTSLDAMCRMIDNGLGVGLLPHRAFELMHHVGDLVALPLRDAWATRQIELIARDFNALPPSARMLVEHLRQTPPPVSS
jgi:DNA-binding transcriptional LysR family regulator